MKHRILLVVCLAASQALAGLASAQRGIGFRFGTDLSYFSRAEDQPVVDHFWTQLNVGAYYQAYFSNGGFQFGAHFIYKGQEGGSGLSFPVVMKDLSKQQNLGITAVETELKVGPRFGPVNPRMGMTLGYFISQKGWIDDTTQTVKLNRTYFLLPLGASAEFPTQYGSVGFGVYYKVGLTNIVQRPAGYPGDWNGSRFRAVNFEITNVFAAGKQKPRRPKVTD